MCICEDAAVRVMQVDLSQYDAFSKREQAVNRQARALMQKAWSSGKPPKLPVLKVWRSHCPGAGPWLPNSGIMRVCS